MSKIPELMSGRKLEHSANIIGTITTQRDVVAAPAAKVGGVIGGAQLVTLTAFAAETPLASVVLPAAPVSSGNLGSGTPVGTLRAGTILRVRAIGVNSASAGGVNLTLNFKLGSTTLYTVQADPAQNEVINLSADIHIGSVGATGAATGSGLAKIANLLQLGLGSAASINTTVAQTLSLTGQWASGPGESITFTNISFEIIGG